MSVLLVKTQNHSLIDEDRTGDGSSVDPKHRQKAMGRTNRAEGRKNKQFPKEGPSLDHITLLESSLAGPFPPKEGQRHNSKI